MLLLSVMDDHQIIIDLKKLLTVAGETSDKKNILIVLGKSSAGADPEGFAKYFADTATVKIANAENLELCKWHRKGTNQNCCVGSKII